MPRPTLRLIACLLLAASPLAAKPPASTDPWQTALTLDYTAAANQFATLYQSNPADTRVAVGYASALLVKQPRTDSNIRTARDILLQVHEHDSAHADHRALATYLLARIELDHLTPAQPDSARKRFEQLRRDHPGHPLADDAALDIAFMLAYGPSGPDASAIPELEALLASVKAPRAARDLHTLIAMLHLQQHKDPASALPHFVAARAIGYEQPLRDADTDLTIGNLAAETGDIELARKHYASFIANAPRDTRASTVRRLLRRLENNTVTVER